MLLELKLQSKTTTPTLWLLKNVQHTSAPRTERPIILPPRRNTSPLQYSHAQPVQASSGTFFGYTLTETAKKCVWKYRFVAEKESLPLSRCTNLQLTPSFVSF